MSNGDQKDPLLRDYTGKGRKSIKSMRLAAGLTCLQFVFAIYATFLLYFMSPAVDLMAEPDMSWTSEITRHWRTILSRSHLTRVSRLTANPVNTSIRLTKHEACMSEEINFEQKVSNDTLMLSLKSDLHRDILDFQQRTRGCESLDELLRLPSRSTEVVPKVTVVLNHFKRKTLCAQLDALMHQTVPFYSVWVLAFGSPNETALRSIVDAYNDPRIFFVGSTYDFKYYGRFQVALQAEEVDYVYILDDDMIPGKRMLQILTHAAGTTKYHNSVLGSIGRILPFRCKDFSFPSYRKYGLRESGLYLPDPAYNLVVEHVLEVDFLSSAWFLPVELVKALFIETPLTFATGEDLHLSYQLQKYRGASSFVLPVDPKDKTTWGDSEHRLAYVSETTVIHKDIVHLRDDQWWRAMSRGFVTQWAKMHPQQSDALFYAHSLSEVVELAPLILRFRNTPGKKVYVVVTGGSYCPCEEAAILLGWSQNSCHDRRFKVFDLEVGLISPVSFKLTLLQEILPAMKGLIQIHSPAIIITVAGMHPTVVDALNLAVAGSNTILVQLPRSSVVHSLWMAEIKPASLRQWSRMRISINVVTQDRSSSLQRLLRSLLEAHYCGDKITFSFNIDNGVDEKTLKIVNEFVWPYGEKIIRRRIIQGGLIRAVSESWYPTSDDDFGLLLEDDVEVSPFYYMWLKYALLVYYYDPQVSFPELVSISLYTPRVIEVVKERPRWNATNFVKNVHPNTPYLHQLPCSWGALFFPRRWREFYKYMGMRYTPDAKKNPVQIPHSRTNGWQASWKKFLIDVMYLRGYVTLYPNFPNQTSFSTNHMEPGAHINASDNAVIHEKLDFEVPLIQGDFIKLLPQQKLPALSKLPVLNLFNQVTTLKGLKSAGAKLTQDVLPCKPTEIVKVDDITGEPLHCSTF
eukprot:c14291_g1_i1 orf=558-3296(+)